MARRELLLGVGRVGYNGFLFPHIVQVKISGTPVEDAAGRTNKQIQWTISAEWTLVSEDGPVDTEDEGGTIDDNVERLREILTTPGRELVVTDQGFGDNFVVNQGMVDSALSTLFTGTAPILDAAYGPKPTFEAWTPVGSNRASHINWSCVVTIPQCKRSPKHKDILSEWTYGVRWSINESRMTTRSISGAIEIPVTRKNATSREIQNTVDKFRESVDIPRVPGFHRSDNYGISPDKRRLEFTIVDTEIPSNNKYFPGMIRMDITHRASTNMKEAGFRSWANTLSGSVEVAPGLPMSLGWVAIQAVINQRFAIARAAKGIVKTESTADKSSALVLIAAFDLQEALFGRTIGFSLTYQVTTDLKTLIKATGLFTPLGGSWELWQTKIAAITGVRGFAQLKHLVKDDIILDVCGGKIPTQIATPRQVKASTDIVPGLDLGKPGPASWIEFNNDFFVRTETNTIIHTPLHSVIADTKKTIEALKEKKIPDLAISKKGSEVPGGIISAIRQIIQVRSPTTFTLIMRGFASKAGFDFPVPNVVKIGQVDAVLKGDPRIEERKTVDMTGQIIFLKKWEKEYFLDQKPEGVVERIIETDGDPTNIPV